MLKVTITYDKQILNKTAKDILDAEEAILDYGRKEVTEIIRKEITPLTTEPRLPTLPFVWSHDPKKQKRLRNAYFKKLPRGSRGGRYQRTHNLVKGWEVGSTGQYSAIIYVFNAVPYLDTVQGDKQYPSHTDSGWAQYDTVLDKAVEVAIAAATAKWFELLD